MVWARRRSAGAVQRDHVRAGAQFVQVVGPGHHHLPALLHEFGAVVGGAQRAALAMGELSLDGEVRPIKGALPIAIQARKEGFEGLVEFLDQYKLAKWTVISVILYYFDRQKEYFIKPTTTKNVIKYFEIKDLVYTSKPNYEFYDSYKKILNEMKKNVHNSLSKDNAGFTGFLRIGMQD